MTERAERLALKKRLGRTWGAFFERHGDFTPVQLAAIPRLLDGQNMVICAPTASGKTEAAIAPLIERHCEHLTRELAIVYITPTRALVNDLLHRLQAPLDMLRISLASKTRDANTFDRHRPAQILITTPESVDSLLASHAAVFASVRAVVIDELHLFDGTPRGDQLRVLLRRLGQIRAYAAAQGDAPDKRLHLIALSATLADPERTAARYFDDAHVVQVVSRRQHTIDLLPLGVDAADGLVDYVRTFRAKGWRKALVFCNSRAEVESYAAALKRRSPFGSAVFAHYSNIAPQRRIEIEEQFAEADVALCVATSTLELGIDIGNIDVVILIGPPGNVSAFAQRIGRGNRRSDRLRVACFYRTPLERLLFEALATALRTGAPAGSPTTFRPSVAVQQMFSLVKQSPTGALRLSTLASLLQGLVPEADVRSIIGHLQQTDYLQEGRPGEWRPGERLNHLFDQQTSAYNDLSVYSNIRGQTARPVEVRDRFTHRSVASVDARWLARPVLTLEGRTLHIEWADGEAIWVTTAQDEASAVPFHYTATRKHLSFNLAQLLPAQLGLAPHQALYFRLPAPATGWWWFHWLGDLYAQALLTLLQPHITVERTALSGLCFLLRDDPASLSWPTWPEAHVGRTVESQYRSLERMLDLGPFHPLLPVSLRRRAVIEQFDVSTFVTAISRLQLTPAPDAALEVLRALYS